MGPGLFLALALFAPGLRAETAVGLDAKGVDPRVAVDNRLGLDVRDESGRPVTREQVLADLKSAAVKRAAEGSFTSSLPKARTVLSALELLADAAATLRMAVAGFALPDLLPGLPGGSPKIAALWLVLLATAPAVLSFCRRVPSRLARAPSRQCSIEVLRC